MILKKSTLWCMLLGILRRMTSLSTACPEQYVIWETQDLVAYLHPSPWTPGSTIVARKVPCSQQNLFHLPEDSFLGLMLGARAVGSLLSERLGVQRCALVYRPNREKPAAELRVLPLHGLEKEWRPHLADEEEFQPYDPGYCSSKSGPRWKESDLTEVRDRIRAKLPDPDAPANLTFFGESTHPCLFSRIVRGEEQQWRVWEDETHVAVLTPFPNTPGLTVVVPRRPLTSDILRLEEADYRGLVLATRTVAQLLEKSLGAWGVALIFEGFEIDYAHAKLIPLILPPGNQPPNVTCSPQHRAIYPGYVTSADGPPASSENLRQIHAKIVQV
ncbi:uncharacterized protein LOC115819035 [Chanos chanos]|uniref:Uncharacterized protein LOC115819035 n=1 Tax=Chanos chanos TaxID=29144 RepID=A0A6J2W2I3_CHACN|nr:uncharacterized protein LOC115819035 [Chanos chanos]